MSNRFVLCLFGFGKHLPNGVYGSSESDLRCESFDAFSILNQGIRSDVKEVTHCIRFLNSTASCYAKHCAGNIAQNGKVGRHRSSARSRLKVSGVHSTLRVSTGRNSVSSVRNLTNVEICAQIAVA